MAWILKTGDKPLLLLLSNWCLGNCTLRIFLFYFHHTGRTTTTCLWLPKSLGSASWPGVVAHKGDIAYSWANLQRQLNLLDRDDWGKRLKSGRGGTGRPAGKSGRHLWGGRTQQLACQSEPNQAREDQPSIRCWPLQSDHQTLLRELLLQRLATKVWLRLLLCHTHHGRGNREPRKAQVPKDSTFIRCQHSQNQPGYHRDVASQDHPSRDHLQSQWDLCQLRSMCLWWKLWERGS